MHRRAANKPKHYHGFQVPAHLCVDCGKPVECGYAAADCRGDNYICTPCADKRTGDPGDPCLTCGHPADECCCFLA